MAFVKYNTTNRAEGQLLVGISASDTVMQSEAGQGALFPTSNAILTLVQYTDPTDPTSEIVKEEDIKMTTRSTDTFNIIRGFAGTSATSFNAGDYIYLNTRSEHIKDLQDEVTRLEEDKLDITAFNSSLRNNLTNWLLFYTNENGDETGLALGPSGSVLQSNGPDNIPTWEVPTTNITGLTQRTTPDMDTDEFVVGGNPNEKVKLSDYRASNGEATAGTSEVKFVTPKQVKDNYDFIVSTTASDTLKISSDNQKQSLSNDNNYVLVKEIQMPFIGVSGSVRVKCDIKYEWNDGSGSINNPMGVIARNGEIDGSGDFITADFQQAIENTNATKTSYQTKTVNIPGVKSLDKIQLFVITGKDTNGFTGGNEFNRVTIQNFRIYYNETRYSAVKSPISIIA